MPPLLTVSMVLLQQPLHLFTADCYAVLNPIFHTQPLPLVDLLICFALSSVVLFAVELEKFLVRRGLIYQAT